MFYQFSSIRGIAYWSVYDPLTSANMTQTFWEPIPGVKNVQMVIGAVPHGEITSQRHIYVFLMTVYTGRDLKSRAHPLQPRHPAVDRRGHRA